MRLDAGGRRATNLAKIDSYVFFKARQRARTLLPAAGHGGAGGPAQTNVFLEMVHHRRAGGIGHIGGGLVFIESVWLLSAALDLPGVVVSMRADFDEVFPFNFNRGGGLLFQPAVARGIG
jgi:hypothetical protein